MQFMKYGFLLVLGIAAQACGDDSGDGGGGDDDDDTGGTSSGGSSNGGSSNGGSSNGGSSNGGSSNGGSSNGGSSNGGSSSGGTGGSGGDCMAGQTNLYESAECEDFFNCIYESACAEAGAQQQLCIDTFKELLTTNYPACVANADVASTCDMVKSDASLGMQYPECVD